MSRERFIIKLRGDAFLAQKFDIYLLHRHLEEVEKQLERELINLHSVASGAHVEEVDPKLAGIATALQTHALAEREEWYKEGLPQISINPFIVAVWSLYESVLADFAEHVRSEKEVADSMRVVSGGHFLARAETYFREYLDYPLRLHDAWRQDLRVLSEVRNSIVHEFGKYSALSEEVRKRIANGRLKSISKSNQRDKIVLELSFAKRSFEIVRQHLLTLLNRHTF